MSKLTARSTRLATSRLKARDLGRGFILAPNVLQHDGIAVDINLVPTGARLDFPLMVVGRC